MATNSITLLDGTTAYASDVEDKVNPLYTDIDNSNIAASAGIVFSKLDAATVASVATVQTITGAKTFSALVTMSAGLTVTGDTTLGTNLLVIDDTNNRIYEGATVTTTVGGTSYQHQITALSAGTATLALISTATGASGVFEVRYHNSASPADGDRIWDLGLYGKNDAATDIKYATILAIVDDVTAGTEDSHISIQAYNAGTLASRILIYGDQVQCAPESLVVGTNTNVTPYGSGEILGLYVKNTSADRRVAMFESTDATASGILYDLYKNSASPAASDVVCQMRFVGNDSAGNETVYANIVSSITDATNGSEDGQLDLRVISSGVATDVIQMISTLGVVQTFITGGVDITVTSASQAEALDLQNNNNSVIDVYGLNIDVSNSGAGDAIGINFTDMSGTSDYMFSFDANATDPTGGGGAATGRIRCLIGGTLRYLAYY